MPSQASVMRQLAPYLSLGTQLTATVLLLGGAGWLIDDRMSSEPWGLVIGLCVGSVVGFVNFLRSVQQQLRREQQQNKEKESGS